MKILKPGKVEMRKFVCEKCGCEFVADKAETKYSLGYYVSYPLCDHTSKLWWDNGEPYEEPTQDDVGKLVEILQEHFALYDELANSIACTLAAYDVTFREG